MENKNQNTEELKTYTVFVTIIPDYALVGIDEVKINGKAQVTGDVRGNDDIDINGQAKVIGSVYGETLKITGKSEVTGEVVENAVKISSAPIDLSPLTDYVSQNNDNAKIPLTAKGKNPLEDLKLEVNGKDTLVLSTGTYYFEEMKIDGGSSLVINGEVKILCAGKIQVDGKSKVNSAGSPYNLVIFVDKEYSAEKKEKKEKGKEIQINGESGFCGLVYAPYSKMQINGKSAAVGNFFGLESDINGEATVSINQPQTQTLASIGVKKAGADTTFALGEVYSFPNPAKRSKRPTIHVECGVADKVEIRIYNIAAELVDSTELYGVPPVINGKYSYEYNWDISDIASGVYIYTIRAKKSGYSDIKATGKAAIIK